MGRASATYVTRSDGRVLTNVLSSAGVQILRYLLTKYGHFNILNYSITKRNLLT